MSIFGYLDTDSTPKNESESRTLSDRRQKVSGTGFEMHLGLRYEEEEHRIRKRGGTQQRR